ncbi:Predicted ester cyclase [Halogranum amylolyticum]|uniref:Predicted ester cyclase n=1 Tax=Halogranum amylolyticum TaxID=660520 RepID=A0A1H8VU00_9EURY|nr:ester cyclase [Halogranum amylolyticum]SEP18886.1 Predicted ester cyclase [Halogranum amylolyticum]
MSSTPTDTTEDRRRWPQQWADEVHGKQNLDFIDECHAPNWVGHFDGEDLTNTEYKEMQRQLLGGFPDAEFVFGPVIVEENTVAGHWVMTGTHTGEFAGLEPTGRSVHVTGTFVTHYDENGRAVETWENIDQFSMLQQLGIAPEDFTMGGMLRTLVNLVKSGL